MGCGNTKPGVPLQVFDPNNHNNAPQPKPAGSSNVGPTGVRSDKPPPPSPAQIVPLDPVSKKKAGDKAFPPGPDHPSKSDPLPPKKSPTPSTNSRVTPAPTGTAAATATANGAPASSSLASHPSQSSVKSGGGTAASGTDSKTVPKINGVDKAASSAHSNISPIGSPHSPNSPPTPSQTLGLPGSGRVAKGNSLSLLLPPSSPLNVGLGLGSSRNKKAAAAANAANGGMGRGSPLLAQMHRLGESTPSNVSLGSNGPPTGHSRRPSIGMRMSPRGASTGALDHSNITPGSGPNSARAFPPGTPVPGLPTEPKELKKFFEDKILVCHICEDVTKFVDVWCMECFFDIDGEHNDPVVLCAECDKDMHKPANKAKHKRKPFGQYYGEMRTAAELGVVSIPDGLPPLCVIQCRNCEEVDKVPTVWCVSCAKMFCHECCVDFHHPQRYREHKRYPSRFAFMHQIMIRESQRHSTLVRPATARPGITDIFGPGSPDKPNGPKLGSSSSTASASGHPSIVSRTETKEPITPSKRPASSAGKKEEIKTPGPAYANGPLSPSTIITTTTLSSPNGTMTSPSHSGKFAPRNNGGQPGDVLQITSCDYEASGGDMTTETLIFRNIANTWDTIGDCQIVQISVGPQHAAAVTSMGTLFVWGDNTNLQLGVDTGSDKHATAPMVVKFPNPVAVKQVACGSVHTMCLTQSGSVYTWGSGLMGILGHESDINRETPTLLKGLNKPDQAGGREEVVWVACGPNNSGVIVRGRADRHQLYIWGSGNAGQCAAGDISPQYQPYLTKIEVKDAKDKVAQFPEVVDLSFGIHHAAAVTKTGELYTWGSNEQGQCGMRKPRAETLAKELGVAVKDVDPTKIMLPKLNTLIAADGTKVARVVCGERHTGVLDTDGCVWGFGAGESHQIGVMDNVDQEVPLRAVLLGDKKQAKINPEVRVVDIDVGSAISSAVTETGDVYVWGFSMESPIPKRVAGIRGQRFQRCAVGGYENVCGLTGSANEVYELHYGEEDDDGNGNEEMKVESKPKKNTFLRGKRLRGIGAGRAHYAVITEAGKLMMWGNNQDLQLGLPEDISEVPHPMEVAPRWQIASIACSYEHSIALTVDGKLLSWGSGAMGKLGHGTDADAGTPTLITALNGVTCSMVAAGASNSGCVTADGRAYVWGSGVNGQIGDDDHGPRFIPTEVGALHDHKLKQIAFGVKHVAALTDDGQLFSWGDNGFFQLGLGYKRAGDDDDEPPSQYSTPQAVTTLIGKRLTHVACGDNVTMVITDKGELIAWGQGETHQLCTGHDDDVATPVRIQFPFGEEKESKSTKVTCVSLSAVSCAALTDTGKVYVWGFHLGDKPTLLKSLVSDGMITKQISCGATCLLMSS